MTPGPRAKTIVSALNSALTDTLGLTPAGNLDEFFATGSPGARYLVWPDLRIALHFDLKPAFLVLDPMLGTLGIVELALPEGEIKADGIGKLVRRHIDTATYARHLLLRDRNLREGKALTVELVLLASDATPEDRQGVEAIGVALREVLRESDSLFHIGVGLLCYNGTDYVFKGRLRRAFPWLLKASREWLTPPPSDPPSTGEPSSAQLRLRRISLNNYRLPGLRQITLSEARVHLVHGPNGSGKSSIVEALELASSGKVERLERAGQKEYADVIRNRGSSGPATIELGWSVGKGEPKTEGPKPVTATGLEKPLDAQVDAGSFRLDQALMDRLVGQFPHERASNFVRAFFPQAKESLSAYDLAAEVRASALPGLKRVLELLDRAKVALSAHEGWRGALTPTELEREAVAVLLNRWLETTAILDLVQRERIVRATVQEARKAGWTPEDKKVDALVKELGAEHEVAPLDAYEREATAAADRLQKKLAALQPTPAGAPGAASSGRVTAEQVDALNAVCRWMFAEDDLKSYGLFGDKLARVINAGDMPTYATLIIGVEKWADPALKQLDALTAACKTIETGQAPPPWPGLAPSTEYDDAAKAQGALLAAGNQVSERFLAKLSPEPDKAGEFDGSLIAAVNELMALFTPARWSYSDVKLPPRFDAGKVGLNFEMGGVERALRDDAKVGVNVELGEQEKPVRAELHLNTAELNLFTVALFMLCATRVPKPLNLLLFDDPLQNMDELTATALARGLAKMVRLWASLRRSEELLLFFHSDDDLVRFRSEVAAAIYRLPWLSPTSASAPPIEAESNAGNVEVQSIKPMLELRKPTTSPPSPSGAS